MSVEHAATSFALVDCLPRLPFRNRRTVGLLRRDFRATHIGRMLWARNHRSNGVSKLVRIGFILGRHGRSRRVAAGGEMMQRKIVRSIVLRPEETQKRSCVL